MANEKRGPWEGANLDGGRYQRLTTLGAGGMGYVYRAFDANLKTHVVIKTPRTAPADDPTYVERFEREIGALVRLSFPHIVPVIDVGRHRGAVYAVMRYLSGGSLASRVPVRRDGRPQPMPPASLRDWLPAIVKALDFVHGAGYVHRDVKPANILFDEHRQAYLSDFGIIKIVGETPLATARGTDEGTVLGSVDYMAPEILLGGSFDGRADQYALAVTVYELLAGRPPLGGDTVQAVMQGHLNVIPRPLRELVPGMPRAVSDAVARALSKSPAERFACCTDFVRAMQGAITEAANRTPRESPPPPRTPPPLPSPILPPTVLPPAVPQAAGYAPLPAAAIAPAYPPPDQRPPSPAGAATATVARAQTAGRPLSPAQRDTDRLPLPTQAASPPPYAPPPPADIPTAIPVSTGRRSRLPLIAGCACAVLLAVGAFFMIVAESDPGESSGLAANPLPRRLTEWKKKADDVGSSFVVDSAPILKEAAYADAAGLEAQLADAAKQRVASAGPKLDELAAELTSMAEALDERRKHAPKPGAESGGESVGRELDDWQSQLLTCAHQLNSLRQTAASPRGAYDSEAVAELTALRGLETAVASDDPPNLEPATLDRAAVLLTARNAALSSRAWNVLLRSGDRRGLDAVKLRFDAASPDRQSELLWSLLVSGRPVSIDVALAHLRANPKAADRFDPRAAASLVEKNPALYEPVLSVLTSHLRDPDALFRLTVVRMRVMKDAWTAEIEEACRSGPLRDRVGDLATRIIADRLVAAYPLARRLLAEHRAVRLDSLTGDELKSLVADAPELAGLLAETWIIRGTTAERQAALAAYDSPGSPVDSKRLFDRLRREPPEEPSALVNGLLPRTGPRAVELAEHLLGDPDVLQPDKIAFATASIELLDRPTARDALFAVAWKNEADGRPWVLRRLLGPGFARKFTDAESERDRQLQAIGRVAGVLSGKFVNKPGATATTAYSLPVPRRDVPSLPAEIETARWVPDSAARRNLSELKAQAAAALDTSPPAYRSTVEAFVRYLDDLEQLTAASYEIARVYEATVVQQLPGAERGLKLNTVADWEFVIPAAYVETFRREDSRYRALSASLPASRSALPWKSDQATSTAGKDGK